MRTDVMYVISSDEFSWAVVDCIQCSESSLYIACASNVASWDRTISLPLSVWQFLTKNWYMYFYFSLADIIKLGLCILISI